jgi:hypothetical protein
MHQSFSYYFCLMMEGSRSGSESEHRSVPLTNESGSDPGLLLPIYNSSACHVPATLFCRSIENQRNLCQYLKIVKLLEEAYFMEIL